MNAPATSEALPYQLEKLSMKMGMYGKQIFCKTLKQQCMYSLIKICYI